MVETIDRLVNREGYTLKGAEAVLRAIGESDLDRRGVIVARASVAPTRQWAMPPALRLIVIKGRTSSKPSPR